MYQLNLKYFSSQSYHLLLLSWPAWIVSRLLLSAQDLVQLGPDGHQLAQQQCADDVSGTLSLLCTEAAIAFPTWL